MGDTEKDRTIKISSLPSHFHPKGKYLERGQFWLLWTSILILICVSKNWETWKFGLFLAVGGEIIFFPLGKILFSKIKIGLRAPLMALIMAGTAVGYYVFAFSTSTLFHLMDLEEIHSKGIGDFQNLGNYLLVFMFLPWFLYEVEARAKKKNLLKAYKDSVKSQNKDLTEKARDLAYKTYPEVTFPVRILKIVIVFGVAALLLFLIPLYQVLILRLLGKQGMEVQDSLNTFPGISTSPLFASFYGRGLIILLLCFVGSMVVNRFYCKRYGVVFFWKTLPERNLEEIAEELFPSAKQIRWWGKQFFHSLVGVSFSLVVTIWLGREVETEKFSLLPVKWISELNKNAWILVLAVAALFVFEGISFLLFGLRDSFWSKQSQDIWQYWLKIILVVGGAYYYLNYVPRARELAVFKDGMIIFLCISCIIFLWSSFRLGLAKKMFFIKPPIAVDGIPVYMVMAMVIVMILESVVTKAAMLL